jgi:hypothetical protein
MLPSIKKLRCRRHSFEQHAVTLDNCSAAAGPANLKRGGRPRDQRVGRGRRDDGAAAVGRGRGNTRDHGGGPDEWGGVTGLRADDPATVVAVTAAAGRGEDRQDKRQRDIAEAHTHLSSLLVPGETRTGSPSHPVAIKRCTGSAPAAKTSLLGSLFEQLSEGRCAWASAE